MQDTCCCPLKQKKTDDAEEKKVRIMRNKEKILKQNSLSLRINIRIGLALVGVVVAVGLIAAFWYFVFHF